MFPFVKKEVLYPWLNSSSIYKTIKTKLDEEGRLRDQELPDDEAFWEGHSMRWVAGGLDGAFGHHAGGNSENKTIQELIRLLAKQSRKPSPRTRRATYLKLMSADALSAIDALLEKLRKHTGVNVQNLYQEALWLAEEGAHRNAVKFGIALLGQFESELHRELILTLGKHDEFTLYSAVAIQNSLSEANEALFELAQEVDGWGRIHLVERIEPETREIKDWLVRQGYRNSIMYEYLAHTCAVKGELHLALEADQADAELFEGAGDILKALIYGGPAEDIDDYEHAPAAIGDYLRLARVKCQEVSQLTVVLLLLDWLTGDDEQWQARLAKGWTEDLRARYRQDCQAIVDRNGWTEKVWAGLRYGDRRLHYESVRAAKSLGMDIWMELYRQLEQSPINASLYYDLIQTEDPERVAKLVAWAEEALPLPELASGPAEEMGLGKEYEANNALEMILQYLGHFPGLGSKLIRTALGSPVIRTRNMAIGALESWPLEQWDEELISEVRQLADLEPVSDVKENISELRKSKGI